MKSLLLKARAKKQKWKRREKEDVGAHPLEDDCDSDQPLPLEENKPLSKSDIVSSLEALSTTRAGRVTAKKIPALPDDGLQTRTPKGNNPSTIKIL